VRCCPAASHYDGGLELAIVALFNDGCGGLAFALLVGGMKLGATPRQEDSRGLCVQRKTKGCDRECRQTGESRRELACGVCWRVICRTRQRLRLTGMSVDRRCLRRCECEGSAGI
jgi:hypothetical protein